MSKVGNPPIALGKVKINDSYGRGWTETYNLQGGTYSAAHLFFAPILNYRALILANTLHVADWSISDSNASHDGYKSELNVNVARTRISTDTAGPPIVIENCENLTNAIKVRFQTGNPSPPPGTMTGDHLTYLIRGIRKSWISGESVINSLLTTVDRSYTPTAISSAITPAQAWLSFLYYVMVGTFRVVNAPATPPADPTNSVQQFTRAFTNPISASRDTGRDPTASKGRVKRQYV